MSDDAPAAERVPSWSDVAGLVHGFYGRRGGTSQPPFDGLNLSYKVADSAAAVTANWNLVSELSAGLRVTRMDQVHGIEILDVDGSEATDGATANAGEADGLFCERPGIALAVMTADCVPILMFEPRRRAVMALHAGWRGTVAGIAEVALEYAERRHGIATADWQIAIGPAIDACCYEVDAEIGERFTSRWGNQRGVWQPRGNKGQLSLALANHAIFRDAGVPDEAIHRVGRCTACHPENYFSHRQSGGKTGRQTSLIGFSTPA